MAIKKLILVLMIIGYLTPAIGVAVNIHFCGNTVSALSFDFEHNEHQCECGKRKMKRDCCKDKTAIVKSLNDQEVTTASNSIGLKIFFLKPLFIVNRNLAPIVQWTANHIRFAHPPPLQKSVSLHLLHRVLLL